MERNSSKSIDEYISYFPAATQITLQEIRGVIHEAASEATETISYSMPAFKRKRILVYFAAYKNHIGFYPTSSGVEAFKNELAGYEISKGAIRFPIDKPLPVELIQKIVRFRVNEVANKK
jgi:uncharacterized protein YdhG (YjbR/CyaY superfamily)